MKLNIPKAIICTVIALLAALALWQIPGADSCKWCVATGGGVLTLVTLLFGIGIKYNSSNVGVNIRVLSLATLFIGISFNVIFALFDFSVITYIIVAALILMVYLLLLTNLTGIAKTEPDI